MLSEFTTVDLRQPEAESQHAESCLERDSAIDALLDRQARADGHPAASVAAGIVVVANSLHALASRWAAISSTGGGGP